MNDYDTLFPDNRCTGDSPLRQAQLVMLRMLKVVDALCRKHHITYWLCSGTLLGAVRHQGFIPWDDDLDIAMLREDYERFLAVAVAELPEDMFLQTKETEPCYDGLSVPCKIRDTKSLLIAPYLEKKTYHKGIFIDIFPFDRYHRTGLQRGWEMLLKGFNNIMCRCYDAEIGQYESLLKRLLARFRPCFKGIIVGYQRGMRFRIAKNKQLGNDRCYMGHGFETPWIRSFKPGDLFPLQEIAFEDGLYYAPLHPEPYLRHIYGADYMTPPPVEKRIQVHSAIIKPLI
jgi:lipopolysaccharide cholinephosphotransferase